MAAPLVADGGTGDQTQAVGCVSKLCSLPLPTNSYPNIHASPNVIDYRVDVHTGFCDRNAFVAAMAKYLEEAAEQAKMVLLMRIRLELECGPMPNVMTALPNIGVTLCSTLQSLADAHY